MKLRAMILTFTMLSFFVVACGEEQAGGWLEDGQIPTDDEYGKPALGETEDAGKGDSSTGGKLLSVAVDGLNTQVWEARNAWSERDTTEARSAGLAWGAESGLSWEEKYQAWIRQMQPVQSTEGYSTYTTFSLTTPWGKTLPAPRLECAETALFLRATFASWYGLPFILSAWDSGPVYFGHFGIRTKTGKYRNSPYFRTNYSDHSGMTADQYTASWPTDSKLRHRKLSSSLDDLNSFLCEDCYAGAYFDEIFLNKRTGYFMVWLLTYAGSMHLASSDNAFHLEPKAVKEGDVLLERWQKKGIGHTLIVKKVEELEGGHMSAELASGSMPRRQPKWESGDKSKSYFTNDYCGGLGESSQGDEYARLGGGIKRFRQPQKKDGYWYLVVPEEFKDFWIMDSEIERIAGRIAAFEELLGSLSPLEMTELLLQKIEEKREHLRHYPASCAARIEREKAFSELYDLQMQHFNTNQEMVDRQYRIFEDYVFAELDYSVSKTCCWNSTTAGMYEIIMEYNRVMEEQTTDECFQPVVFMAMNGGYDIFKQYAQSIDKGDEWVAWNDDETCPQKDVTDDTEAEHGWTPFCTIATDILDSDGSGGPCSDEFDDNHSAETAATLEASMYEDLVICQATGSDWFSITTQGQSYVILAGFSHELGDIDLELYDSQMAQVDTAAGSSDTETVKIPGVEGIWYLEVKLYGNATMNSYSLTISE